jgi:hypothetical protein
MSDFKILFTGLICHVGADGSGLKTHAAIIDERTVPHQPAVLVQGMPTRVLAKDDVITFRVDDVEVKGPAQADAAFLDHVPHLNTVTDGTLRPGVLAANSDASALGYVMFPPGSTLSVEEHYPLQAVFTLAGTEVYRGCVARVIALTIPNAAKVDLLINHTLYSELSANVPAGITNASPGGKHFRFHLDLTAGSKIADVSVENTPCGASALGPLQAPDIVESIRGGARFQESVPVVECTNSQWP